MVTRDFITAGKAIFTVSNGKGDHYTYRITHREATAVYREMWAVALLTGPDNLNNYTYLGVLNQATGETILTRNSKFTYDSVPVRVIRWALGIVWRNGVFPNGYQLYHEGRCGRCGRVLTVPSSIESGIGPECAKIMVSI